MPLAKNAAVATDVTLQEITTVGHEKSVKHDLGGGASVVVSECIEEYPILHLATHGMKWELKVGGDK